MSVPAAFVGVVFVWGTAPLAVQWSNEGAGYLFGATARMVLGVFVCLVLVALLSRRMLWHRSALATYLVAGLGLWGAMSSFYWGAQYVPSGLAAVLYGLSPPVTAAMAAVWLKEPALTGPRLFGMGASLLGLWAIFGAGPGAGAGLDRSLVLGAAGILASVAIASASAVWVKRIDAGLHPLETTTGSLMIAVPLFVLHWLLMDGRLAADLGPRAAWSIVYLGVVVSALGFVLYYYLLARVQASRVALGAVLAPVLALAVGYAFNGEVLTLESGLGTGLILAGLALFHWGDEWQRRFAARWRARAVPTQAPA